MRQILGNGHASRVLLAAIIILTSNLLFLSCGRGGPDSSSGGGGSTGIKSTVQEVPCPVSGTTNVTVQNESFTPQTVSVLVNGVVKWTNQEQNVYYWVISDTVPGGSFKIPAIKTGESACLIFTAPGTYIYHCDPEVQGTVIVTAPTNSAQ